jgi:hypothetical protein
MPLFSSNEDFSQYPVPIEYLHQTQDRKWMHYLGEEIVCDVLTKLYDMHDLKLEQPYVHHYGTVC